MSRVIGIGLDVVDLDRFAAAFTRHGERLVARIAGPAEIRPLVGRARIAHVAGLFAAKEAVLKALGTGWARGLGFRQIEIGHDDAGAPQARLRGAAARQGERLGLTALHVSITHDRGCAAALAVLEGGET